MADYVSSALLAFQSKINKKFNAAELREQQNPILRKALGYSDFIIGNVADIKASDKRTVYTYMLKKMASSNGTARAVAPTGVQADSAQITLNWVTFQETLSVFMQVGADNVFDTMTLLDHQIMQKQMRIRERIGTYIVQQLHNNRTQTAPFTTTARNMNWSAANSAYENDAAEITKFFQNAASIMRQNKYYDKLDAIVDPIVFKQADFLRSQGAANGTNLSFQFSNYNPDGIMEHAVLGSTVSVPYASGSAIVLPNASFALIPWIPKINREGYGDYESFNGGYGTVPDASGAGIEYAVRGWAQKADGSSNGSVVQDIQINLELSVDVSFNVAPLSTATESAIYEFGQL
jgi:hypothetical protein